MAYPYYPYPMYQPQPIQQPTQPQQSSRVVEVFPVESEQAVSLFPVNNGATQMLIDRSDRFIAVKSVALDGTVAETYYDKRPPAQPEPAIDYSQFVKRDEIAELIASAMVGAKKQKKEASDE